MRNEKPSDKIRDLNILRSNGQLLAAGGNLRRFDQCRIQIKNVICPYLLELVSYLSKRAEDGDEAVKFSS